MIKEVRDKLIFETFTEFCDRADEILYNFKIITLMPDFNLRQYKNYIYYEHNFSDNKERDMLAKDKCWLWLMSYKYESMDKNDLYSTLGQLRKGK